MHRNLILPLLGVVLIGASATAPTAPASTTPREPTAHQVTAAGLPQPGARPTGLTSPRFGAEGFHRIADRKTAPSPGASPEDGLAQAPGCSQSAPLFRSHMPRLVAWQGGGRSIGEGPALRLQPVAQAKGRPEGAAGRAEPQPDLPPAGAEEPAFTPAMHQAVHLCVVDRFSPSQKLGGASRAFYRL